MNDNIQITDPSQPVDSGGQKKRPGVKPKAVRLTISLLIAEYQSGKSTKQIAALYNYTTAAIGAMAKRHGYSLPALRAYKERRADLFAFKQSQIVEAMTPEKIAAASLRDQATTFNILHNAERLERGQSTQNLDFNSLGKALSDLEVEELRLKAELAKLGHNAETVEPIVGGGEPDAVQR